MGATARATRRVVASARKYDLLTAIALGGLSGTLMWETLALRFIALITARYDWTRDTVSVGQHELRRLWPVSRRTVIRDVTDFRRIGVLVLIEAGWPGQGGALPPRPWAARRAAGADHRSSGRRARSAFARAGRRIEKGDEADEPAPCGVARPETTDAAWSAVHDAVGAEIGAAAATRWLTPLRSEGVSGGALRLRAPTPFHADYAARLHGARLDAAVAALLRARRVDIRAG